MNAPSHGLAQCNALYNPLPAVPQGRGSEHSALFWVPSACEKRSPSQATAAPTPLHQCCFWAGIRHSPNNPCPGRQLPPAQRPLGSWGLWGRTPGLCPCSGTNVFCNLGQVTTFGPWVPHLPAWGLRGSPVSPLLAVQPTATLLCGRVRGRPVQPVRTGAGRGLPPLTQQLCPVVSSPRCTQSRPGRAPGLSVQPRFQRGGRAKARRGTPAM